MENSTCTPHHVSPPKYGGTQNISSQQTPSSEGDYLTPERYLPRQPQESGLVPRTDPERDIADNPETSEEKPDVMIGEAYFLFHG